MKVIVSGRISVSSVQLNNPNKYYLLVRIACFDKLDSAMRMRFCGNEAFQGYY